ncbi:MAG: 2-polyprenylphenol 6-hydroxylase, partial [Roseovarius gahaiensis]
QRTMVVVEGVARSLSPQINIWQVARPVVEDYIRKNIGPRAVVHDLQKTLAVLARYGPRLPGIVENALIRQSMPLEPPRAPNRLSPAIWAVGGAGLGGAAVLAAVLLS